MSRASFGAWVQPDRHLDDLQRGIPAARVGTGVVRSLRNDGRSDGPGPADDEASMNAKTEAARDGVKWTEDEAPGRRKGTPIGVLGFAALGLWVLAVFLGIGAPLLGIDIDARLVVAVLLASGRCRCCLFPSRPGRPARSPRRRTARARGLSRAGADRASSPHPRGERGGLSRPAPRRGRPAAVTPA